MTRASRRRAHTIGLVLMAALMAAAVSHIQVTAERQRVALPDGIVLCEVTDEIARCEMIAGAEE